MNRRDRAVKFQKEHDLTPDWPPTLGTIIRNLRKWAVALELTTTDNNWTFDGKIGRFSGYKPNGDLYYHWWAYAGGKWLTLDRIVSGIEIEAATGGHVSPALNVAAKGEQEMREAIQG